MQRGITPPMYVDAREAQIACTGDAFVGGPVGSFDAGDDSDGRLYGDGYAQGHKRPCGVGEHQQSPKKASKRYS